MNPCRVNFDVGRDRELRNARFVVDPRSGNGDARIEVSNHGMDTRIDHTLRHYRSDVRVALIVADYQLELYCFVSDSRVARIELVDRHLGAVQTIAAIMRLRTSKW